MAVTKSWESPVAARLNLESTAKSPERSREALLLAFATFMVAAGLALVFISKTQDFPQETQRLTAGELLNLNAATSAEQISAAFPFFNDSGERAYVAERIWDYVQQHRPLPNDGALWRVRLRASDAASDPRARSLWLKETTGAKTPPTSVPLFPLAKIKPLIVVRTPQEFLRTYLIWGLLYLAAFWLVHIVWRVRRFRGDPNILPAIYLLTGMGLILMVSLRDPLRDTLEFKKFAWGVLIGCALLLLPLFRFFQYRVFSRWIYTPLFAAIGLFLGLFAFGSGPTGSDAKVNLGPFQPVELIKILIVFFLAGYFAQNWERLRDLHQKAFIPRAMRWFEMPRISHTLPVMVGVSCALVLFFVLKDMGPALVIGFLFLTLFAVARGRVGLPILGIAILIIGVTLGVHYGSPHTVSERVSMWLSPWNNDVHGGDQLAHSLWAFATGGPLGSGPGWGDPSVIPAGHTDLVLASIAEEWGLPGVLSVCGLLGLAGLPGVSHCAEIA